ncbi:signal transduction histidine kinase [Planomicrobium koreense]|uniref:histidine kinase n=1 Tax=Planococcus koreensis TaxID=112331 RepID=A0A7W8CQW1_9BACL|nr:ATP-binding protein [Planococcus koreensis]MBB5179219.1 signal transduction histidine kinase [Planococcus koreensis]
MSRLYRNVSIAVKIVFILFIMLFFITAKSPEGGLEESGETLILTDSMDKIHLDSEMSILEDISGSLTMEEVSQPILGMQFMPNIEGTLNEGYTESAYWIRFDLQNTTADKKWLLEVASSTLDDVTLYMPAPGGGFEAKESGRSVPVGEREYYHRNLVFNLDMEEGAAGTFYLHVKSGGPMQIPVAIWEEKAFEAETRSTTALIGLGTGIAIVITAYHLFQFMRLRQLSFLYFALLSMSILFAISSLTGLTLAFIWPDMIWWNERSILFFIGLSTIFLLLFTESFLDIRRHLPWLEKVFKGLIAADLIMLLVLLMNLEAIRLILPLMLVASSIAVFIISVICLEKHILYARYYTVGTFLLMFGIAVSFLVMNGYMPFTLRTRHGGYLAVGLGILMAALALNDKAAVKRLEKQELERKAVERQRLAMESLKHANERKDELLAITSHNLRTPLYGMIGIAESLQEMTYGRIPQNANQQLGTIVTSGKKLAHMINDILDFSKLKQNALDVHVEPVKLLDLAETVLTVCRPLLKDKDVSLYHTIPDDLPEVIADPDRVQQVLFNLLDNSIKYTVSGEIVITANQIGKQIQISVRDTGIGIKEEEIPTLFEPFPLKLESDVDGIHGTGIGIGLNISKRLVELQGGWMEVESKAGKGSTFSFTLPIYMKEELAEPQEAEKVEIEELSAAELTQSLSQRRREQKQIRILVVDHIDVNRQMVTYHLMREGFEVTGVSEGKEALKLLGEQPIDLVILEWALADMTGDELCRSIRKEFTLTELPILMMSEEEGMRHKTNAFTAGANDYLVKPCDKEEFLLRVETLANLRSLTQEITNVNYFLERNIKERTMALEITNMNLVTVNDEIQEIEKSRNEMLSTISHELGTPITLIHSYIQAVKESLIDEKNPRYLDMIHNKLLLLERLTEDLTELSKYKSGNMTLRFEEVKLSQWLNRLTTGMESDVTQSGRKFEHSLRGRNPLEDQFILSIDVDRIDQVFSNVLWNAVKHTSSEDGKITISTEVYASGTEGAVLDLEEFEGEVIIKVADTGSGIDQEVLPHIFDRFFKMEKSEHYKGSGLGLAIAKEIILSHKGEIWAESEPGKGSVFYIALPLSF